MAKVIASVREYSLVCSQRHVPLYERDGEREIFR